ncbi:MAG: hypothetical protein K0S71_2266 [Clostridia bacterium]|jgi:hypothetical protein|nr:hypothetical protein [Clostridia bacterium]
MSPIAQQVIETLAKEQDTELLSEVLDFYEYIKHKKHKHTNRLWDSIEEDEATPEEIGICNRYKDEEHEFVDFHSLVQELGIDE